MLEQVAAALRGYAAAVPTLPCTVCWRAALKHDMSVLPFVLPDYVADLGGDAIDLLVGFCGTYRRRPRSRSSTSRCPRGRHRLPTALPVLAELCHAVGRRRQRQDGPARSSPIWFLGRPRRLVQHVAPR